MNTKNYDILFIEDEQAIRENYISYLKKNYRYVYESENGLDAYETYKEKKPHILIVDINLPKLNGLELVQKIREKDYTTKIIMLTAHSDTKNLLHATELKLTKYLIKPITRDELKSALNLACKEFLDFDILSKNTLQLKENFIWNYDLEELFSNFDTLVPLTNKEKSILILFLSNINKTFTYNQIICTIWKNFDETKLDALKTIIKNLRKKLPQGTIKNIFGIGYKIENL